MKDNPVFWKQANGKLVSVDEMDTNHLRNVLKMIIRNNEKVQTTCPHNATQALEMEDIQLNGDMANEFNDSHLADEYDECDATEIDIY